MGRRHPRRHAAHLVLAESFWIGLLGAIVGLPASFALAGAAELLGVRVLLPFWLLTATTIITLAIAMGSSLAALRPSPHRTGHPAALTFCFVREPAPNDPA